MLLLILIVVIIFVAFWCFQGQKEGLLGGGIGRFSCPKHTWCGCIDETGWNRGPIRVGLEYRGGGLLHHVKCRIKDHKRVCQSCKDQYGKEPPRAKSFTIGDCSMGGVHYERTHCPEI